MRRLVVLRAQSPRAGGSTPDPDAVEWDRLLDYLGSLGGIRVVPLSWEDLNDLGPLDLIQCRVELRQRIEQREAEPRRARAGEPQPSTAGIATASDREVFYLGKTFRSLVMEGDIDWLVIATCEVPADSVLRSRIEQLTAEVSRRALLHVELAAGAGPALLPVFTRMRSLRFPEQRSELYTALFPAEAFEAMRDLDAPAPSPSSVSPPMPAPRAVVRWEVPDQQTEASGRIDVDEPTRGGELLNVILADDHPLASAPAESPAPVADEVQLGVGVPIAVSPGEEFVIRFAAYLAADRDEVQRILHAEAPASAARLDLETALWRPGARVSVCIEGTQVRVSAAQTFRWSRMRHVLRFDASVLPDASGPTVILRVRVSVEGLPMLVLRPEIELVRARSRTEPAGRPRSQLHEPAPRSAFASYASADRGEVMSRIRSLQIFTGIDVFLDCLSLRPGEQWKSVLRAEIDRRDTFWLFWSRDASRSPWVEWEWRTALASRSLDGIQPHPLQPADIAPPPPELAALQFGNLYEQMLGEMRGSRLTRSFRRFWRQGLASLGW